MKNHKWPNQSFLVQAIQPQPAFNNLDQLYEKGHLVLVADLEHGVLALAQGLQPLDPRQLLHLLVALLSTKCKAAPSPGGQSSVYLELELILL